MSTSSMPMWVLSARRYFATDKSRFLVEAIDACSDPEISKLCYSLLTGREIDANEAQPVLGRIASQGRSLEAMMLMILGLSRAGMALWNAGQLDREHEEAAHVACLQLVRLSRNLDFPECEAKAALTLGAYYVRRRERRKSVELIQSALELYRPLAQAEPDLYRHSVAAALNNLGAAFLDEGNLRGAREAFEEAEQIHRDLTRKNPNEYRRFLAWTLRNFAILLRRVGEGEVANQMLREAKQLESGSFEPQAPLGKAPQSNLPAGRQERLKPNRSPEAERVFLKAWSLLSEGRLCEALERLDTLIRMNPRDTDAWYERGVAQFQLKRFADAIESFEAILKLNPDDSLALAGKGITLAKTSRYQEAVEYFAKATALDPGDAITWTEMGKSLARLDKYDEALKCFHNAVDVNPRYGVAWYEQGVTLQKVDKHREALDSLDKALEIDPEDADAWNQKGISLAQLGLQLLGWKDKEFKFRGFRMIKQALESWDKALELDPNNVAAMANRRQFEQYGLT